MSDLNKTDDTNESTRTLLVLGAVIILAATPYMSFLRYGALIEKASIGNRLALSAVLIAIGGFGVTIWQLLRTSSASHAVKAAIKNLQFRFQAFGDQQLCRDSLTGCGEIQRMHSLLYQYESEDLPAAAYFFLPERYRALNLTLTELRARIGGALNDEQQTVVQVAVTKLADAAKALTRNLGNRSGISIRRLEPLQTALQNLAEMLTALSVALDQRVIGD
jgi:hypothetical protein